MRWVSLFFAFNLWELLKFRKASSREAEELEIIERQKAKQRMSEGGKGVEKLPQSNNGKSRDKIASQTGIARPARRCG